MQGGAGFVFAAFAAHRPAGHDQRRTGDDGFVKVDAEPAEDRRPRDVLDREIAGAVERGPDELGTDRAVIGKQRSVRRPDRRDLVGFFAGRAGEDAQAVALCAVRSADEAGRENMAVKASVPLLGGPGVVERWRGWDIDADGFPLGARDDGIAVAQRCAVPVAADDEIAVEGRRDLQADEAIGAAELAREQARDIAAIAALGRSTKAPVDADDYPRFLRKKPIVRAQAWSAAALL